MRAKYYAGHTTLFFLCARLVLCMTGVLELDLIWLIRRTFRRQKAVACSPPPPPPLPTPLGVEPTFVLKKNTLFASSLQWSAALRLWSSPHGQVWSRISIPRRKPHPPISCDDAGHLIRAKVIERSGDINPDCISRCRLNKASSNQWCHHRLLHTGFISLVAPHCFCPGI
jgi:hypothetical protein